MHKNVRCGYISWQLAGGESASNAYTKQDNRHLTEKSENTPLKASYGMVLIKARNKMSDAEFIYQPEPLKQLAVPLKVQVSYTENEVEAVYLPPPILLNLRLRQNEEIGLTERQIQQLKDDGGNATLFIHGYNVPLGHMGRFATDEEVGERLQYDYRIPPEQLQRPYLYCDNALIKKAVMVEYIPQNKGLSQQPNYKTPDYKPVDSRLNGKSALSWFPHVEYYLNLAASGKDELSDFDLWDKYSRIVGVTWSGSVDPDMNFFRAEMYANEAGRRLAKVLQTLIENNIRINIITHSLGARVALSAMNILGDFDNKYENKINNLILWEPAVADNALTNLENYEDKKTFNPFAMELFPYAHKVPEHITVLYSQEDGVLGSDNTYGDREMIALLGGAYPSKYASLMTGNSALKEYYKGTQIRAYEKDVINIKMTCDALYAGAEPQRRPDSCVRLEQAYNLRRYQNEIAHLVRQEAAAVKQSDGIAELTYLKPWSHFRRFPEEVLNHIIDVLVGNVLSDWEKTENYFQVRPALGHQGDRRTVQDQDKWGKKVPAKEAKRWHDDFIASLPKTKLEFFGQLEIRKGENFYYFISHSAMREWEWEQVDVHQVFPLIYKYSYKEWIMDRKIQEHSKFGRY